MGFFFFMYHGKLYNKILVVQVSLYLFLGRFLSEPLDREEPDESDELDDVEEDLEPEEELLEERELSLELPLLLDDLEL